MERLTSLANSHSQTVDKLQSLEGQLEKSSNQNASLEAKEKKVKEEASLVSLEVHADTVVCVFAACCLLKK